MLIYKRGKGNVSRGVGVAALAAMGLFGCTELYHFIVDLGREAIELPWGGLTIAWSDLIAGTMAALCGVGIFLLANNARVVDFLLETEAELKKVSWSSPQVLFSNTVVVIVSVIVLAAFILVTDKVVSEFIRLILG